MIVCCIADMHGNLPEIPPCDLLLIGGDLCPTYNHEIWFQEQWLKGSFVTWRLNQPAKHAIYVAGNHDFFLAKQVRNHTDKDMAINPTWLKYLQDDGCTVEGLKIWGSPWQKPFFGWAFNLPEKEMAKKWELIPKDTDILLLHGPPYGYGDYVSRTYTEYGDELPGEHTGSPSLLKKIEEIKPKLVVFGHIHEHYGKYKLGETLMVNASIVNEQYKMVNKPWILEC